MTEPKNVNGGVKTLAIRLPDELHAQLVIVAQLDGLSLTDAIRQAIDGFIDRKRGEGNFADQAALALQEIEREAEARRAAIQALLGSGEPPVSSEAEPRGRSRGRGSA